MVTAQKYLAEHLSGVKWWGSGLYFSARCVWHDDRRPSMLVYTDMAVCRSCGRRGSLSEVLKRVESGVVSTNIYLPPRQPKGFIWGGLAPEEIAGVAHETLINFADAQDYLRKRGVESRIETNRLGWYKSFFTIPIFDKTGKFLDLVVRASPEVEHLVDDPYTISPGGGKNPFVPDWRLVEKSDRVFVVFGMFDALGFAALRLPVLSPTAGKDSYLRILPALLELNKPTYIVPDLGEEIAAYRLVASLGWRGEVIKINYPDGVKDPSGMIETGRVKTLLSRLQV